jgi:hypothetical protein
VPTSRNPYVACVKRNYLTEVVRSRLSFANVVASAALFLALGGGAYAATNPFVSPRGTIRACVTKGGDARVLVSPNTACRTGETLVRWNQRGQTGAAGTPGTAGGPAGATGATGAKGETGERGAAGEGVDAGDYYTKDESDGQFLGIAGKATDADSVDGLDSSQLTRADRLVAPNAWYNRGALDQAFFDVVGVEFRASCIDLGPNTGVQITASASQPDTFITFQGAMAPRSTEVDPVDGPVTVYADDNDTGLLTSPGIVPVTVAIGTPSGGNVTGTLAVGLNVFGSDCNLAGTLLVGT